ncbi:MAG: HAMP domain-containing histidine kinase [Actinomycetota bacterium]|nr:HAMP domain-containing histidine kinase [Actinomycetota bacterium]
MRNWEGSGFRERAVERWGSVRVRTTALAVIVVGAALIIAGIAMVVLLRSQLIDRVELAALRQAQDVAEDFSPADDPSKRPEASEDEFIQVVDAQGTVVASSDNVADDYRRRAIVEEMTAGDADAEPIAEIAPFVKGEDGPFLAVAVEAETSNRDFEVIVGKSLEPVSDTVQAVAVLLLAGIPLLLLVVGSVSARVAGSALAPVEAMRDEVERISSRDLHRRVPQPPGGDEISRLATTMNGMLARLEKGQARQRRFISDASHELRSPVATIRQHAEVALAHPEISKLEELADVVLQENTRLQGLVEDLLLLSHADEGTMQLRTQAVDVDDLVFEEAKRLRATTELRVRTSRVSAGRVSGDKGQLNRLIRNLSNNAARHARGVVEFSLRDGDESILLTVDDDGGGVAPSERERIFERFVRLEEGRDRDSGGTGLGLAIVAEIATAHAATVGVADSPLGGARFEVRFHAAE